MIQNVAPRICQKPSTFNLKSIEYANYIVKSKYCEIKSGLICLWNDMVALKINVYRQGHWGCEDCRIWHLQVGKYNDLFGFFLRWFSEDFHIFRSCHRKIIKKKNGMQFIAWKKTINWLPFCRQFHGVQWKKSGPFWEAEFRSLGIHIAKHSVSDAQTRKNATPGVNWYKYFF